MSALAHVAADIYIGAVVAFGAAVLACAFYERGANDAIERIAAAQQEEARRIARRVALLVRPFDNLRESIEERHLYDERSALIESHLAIARIERDLRKGSK